MQLAAGMFRKILCPIDFSDASRDAMRVAARIAGTQTELVLAHAWYVPPLASAGEYPFPPQVTQEIAAAAERGLAEEVRQATMFGASTVTTALTTGIPWDRIVDTLRNDPAFDLVVMGPHGRSALARVLLGSVTEKVVRHAPCPVLVARGKPESFTRVLCPVDFSDSSRDALALAAQLVAPGGAITLLHVIELPLSYTGGLFPVSDYVDPIHKQSTDMLEDWASDLRSKTSLPVETRIEIGGAGAKVLDALDETTTFDLVAMGRHGRTGLRRVLLGSVAEKVVRHAGCSVVVARPHPT